MSSVNIFLQNTLCIYEMTLACAYTHTQIQKHNHFITPPKTTEKKTAHVLVSQWDGRQSLTATWFQPIQDLHKIQRNFRLQGSLLQLLLSVCSILLRTTMVGKTLPRLPEHGWHVRLHMVLLIISGSRNYIMWSSQRILIWFYLKVTESTCSPGPHQHSVG